MNKNIRKQIYSRTKYDNLNKEEAKVSLMSQSLSCNYLPEIIFLTKEVPNWKLYLNDKQVKILELYIGHKNIGDVSRLLNIKYASVYSAIYGSSTKDEQGIFGRLKKIYAKINKNNNTDDLGKILKARQKAIDNIKESTKNINHKERIMFFAKEIPNYGEYLTNRQLEIFNLFLEHRSYSKVDKIIGSQSCWSTLYGSCKLNPKGVYRRLEKAYDKLNIK